MSKRLYDQMKDCKKEEEVKSEFCKFFKMKINALKCIDHYTEQVLFEFKCDRNFKNAANVAHVLAQTMYYARLLKFSLTKYPLPPVLCVVDKNEAFFAETKKFSRFFSETADRYDWDRAASTPCPKLVADVLKFISDNLPYVYDLTVPAEEEQFVAECRKRLTAQLDFLSLLEKKSINEENFLDVYDYWNGLFGDYVRNGRKPSEYFLSDIEEGKSLVAPNGQILFAVSGATSFVPKTLKKSDYDHFWQNYDKVKPSAMLSIRQKADRISEDFHRRFTGEFYTPVDFARKGLDYLERTIGKEWWKTGEYRFWDMAAGTGNLEFPLPSDALKYCYISTLDADDAQYLQRLFPSATCFQYDYLADDAAALSDSLPLGFVRKMPPNLAADLANPAIKWIIFINPPFATANNTGGNTGKTSKDSVSMTSVRSLMNAENYGEASRELYVQFLFRISREFKNRQAHLCMFSTLKYLNSNNDQKIRDGFFQFAFERGFIFPIKSFYGATGDFPVGFLVWNLAKRRHLAEQDIALDVFNADVEKIGTKKVPSVERTAMLNKWVPRPKWDGKSIMPTFSSATNIKEKNKDSRNHIAPGFLCSVVSKGDDMQNQNWCCILSGPSVSAGAFSVTPENFEKAMVLHAVKKIPKKTWTNNRDAFYAPTGTLPDEFVSDCVVWSAFAGSNNAAALKDVAYQGRTWQIANELFPFSLAEVREWPCGHPDIAAQRLAANDDRFLAKWLKGMLTRGGAENAEDFGRKERIDRKESGDEALRPLRSLRLNENPDNRVNPVENNLCASASLRDKNLSTEAQAVLDAGRALFRYFSEHICETAWAKFKVATWDAGLYQITQSLKDVGMGADELAALRTAHDALRAKLLPQIYAFGFLNPDIELFT